MMVKRGVNEEPVVIEKLGRVMPDCVSLPIWHITNIIFVNRCMAIVNVYAFEAEYNAIFAVIPVVHPSGKVEVSVRLPRGRVRQAKPFMTDKSENGTEHFRFYVDKG